MFPFSAILETVSALATKYKFTVDEFARLYETGIIGEDDHIELLNGELIIMHAVGARHAQAVTNFNMDFAEQARRRYMVSPQNPVELERYSAPEPDITLVPWSRRKKAARHPNPEEVLLMIEVADSSLRYDRGDKMRAYAAVGIREFWILNLEDDQLEIFRKPSGDEYLERSVVPADGTASPLAFPDVSISLSEIIPPR